MNEKPVYSRVAFCRLIIGLLPLVGLCACTPLSEQEKEYFEARQAEKDTLEAFGTKLSTGAEQTVVILQVQEHINDEGLTEEQWLRKTLAVMPGTMVSYRWNVRKKGEKIYEVQYRYTLLNEKEEVVKEGYAWEVDNVIKKITGPRPMQLGEMEYSAGRRHQTGQRARQQKLAETTLE